MSVAREIRQTPCGAFFVGHPVYKMVFKERMIKMDYHMHVYLLKYFQGYHVICVSFYFCVNVNIDRIIKTQGVKSSQ